MVTRETLMDWVVEALRAQGGISDVVRVAKYIWDHHEQELRHSGDMFYTWQYEVRWAGTKLRKAGRLKGVDGAKGLPWELGE